MASSSADIDKLIEADSKYVASLGTPSTTATTTTTAAVAASDITDIGEYRKEKVPPELWNDWRWQMKNRLTRAEQLRTIFPLTPEEEAAFRSPGMFPVAVTPYFASLIDGNDPRDPIRMEILPRAQEARHAAEDIEDSLGEDKHMPVPGLVHRYPDRVLMLVSMTCGSYCRFCTRNRVVGTAHYNVGEPLSTYYTRQLDYIRGHPEVRDVVLSGGDPLLLPLRTLEWLLSSLRAIETVEIVRIGSRVPIFLPQRITPELCDVLKRHHPLWLNTHVNHPNELSPEAAAGLARLADAGIPLGSQTVLLAGINDCPNIMLQLMRKLVRCRVRPYYIYQCDLVVGAAHFRTPVPKLYEIMEALRGHTSGLCVPTAVIDSPHGGGKVPVMPSYVLSMSETKTIVRNFEGYVSTYTGPKAYVHHDQDTCKYCREAKKKKDKQAGVAGLIAGNADAIKPEGWDNAHIRNGTCNNDNNNTCDEKK